MFSVPQFRMAPASAGRMVRAFSNAAVVHMQDQPQNVPAEKRALPDVAAIRDVERLSGAELGMAVARELMQWHSDHEQYTDCWVDSAGKLTGYYYGHPFSPYRDRNALGEVWKRIDALGLREHYLACIGALHGERALDAWTLHTCAPELACRAALLAVRSGS